MLSHIWKKSSIDLTIAGKKNYFQLLARRSWLGLQSTHLYDTSIFKLPKKFYEEINHLIINFWWGNYKSWGINWLPLKVMCLSKGLRGLGFQDFGSFNLALLAKHGRQIISNPSSLYARVFKFKYFMISSFLDCPVKDKGSYTWKNILVAREVLQKGFCWNVANGFFINV